MRYCLFLFLTLSNFFVGISETTSEKMFHDMKEENEEDKGMMNTLEVPLYINCKK